MSKTIGSINPCGTAALLDRDGKVLGYTLDTPNAIAYAMAVNEDVFRSRARYQGWEDTYHTRESLMDRFSWVVKDKRLSSYLIWV